MRYSHYTSVYKCLCVAENDYENDYEGRYPVFRGRILFWKNWGTSILQILFCIEYVSTLQSTRYLES